MLRSFNNCNIIQFTNKITSSEDSNEVHNVVIDRISENMDSLAQLGKYGAIKEEDPTTMVYYIIKCLSEPYKLQ